MLALLWRPALAADGGVGALVQPLLDAHPGLSGLYVLDKGEDSLLARSWMIDHASASIDAQYFIWTADNVGTLASEALLRAAERGVKVRIIVDDLLVDAPPEHLLFLASRANIAIRIYNPDLNLGVSPARRAWNTAASLKAVNQRMHDKTFVTDGTASITGGRNIADEYFGYHKDYDFRDRDILALGPAARAMAESFERFWNDPRSVPVEKVLADKLASVPPGRFLALRETMRAYAADPANLSPAVRAAAEQLPRRFPEMLAGLAWADARFISDIPGKNAEPGVTSGGGATTRAIIEAVSKARKSLTIQSPYCVLTPKALDLLSSLVKSGVDVRIVTNSLAASDNLRAWSGYLKQRGRMLTAGIKIFEYRPDPAVRARLLGERERPPVFAIHAKSLVVDGETLFIGTFNLDPRSAHLNTEVGILVTHPVLAAQVEKAIEEDMAPENSWKAGEADSKAPLPRRIKAYLYRLLPLDPLL